MKLHYIVLLIAVASTAVLPARAQSNPADSLRRAAFDSYRDKQYARSAASYSALTSLGKATAIDLYNAACSFALAGEPDSAFTYLDRSLTQGFDSFGLIPSDSDLQSLHSDHRWTDLASRIDAEEKATAQLLASLPDPMKAFGAIQKNGVLTTLIALEEMERQHDDAPNMWRSLVGEALAWTRAIAGEVKEAIAAFDQLGDAADGNVPADFNSYTPVDVVQEILTAARNTRLVMVNEAHHVPMHRVLTTQLLDGLYRQGYRYLALEAVNPKGAETANRPTMATGTYTKDPVFAHMLRAATQRGFTIVAYDTTPGVCTPTAEDPGKCFTARDSMAAVNLYQRTFAKDSQAKVLVHAGYSHVVEHIAGEHSARPLAYWLARMTGVDPLTVDQTLMYEHSAPMYDPAEYRTALSLGWLKMPVVLRKGDGTYYRSTAGGFHGVDMQVFTPPAREVRGRPDWLFDRTGRLVVRTDVQRDAHGTLLDSLIPREGGPFLIQAYVAGESDDAIPFDQFVVDERSHPNALALVRGDYVLKVTGRDGEVGSTKFRVK